MEVPYPVVFAVNLAVEAAALAAVLRDAQRRVWIGALLANLATHPLVWFAVPTLDLDWWSKMLAAEAGVVVVEAAVLWLVLRRAGHGPRGILAGAVVANAASFALTFALPF